MADGANTGKELECSDPVAAAQAPMATDPVTTTTLENLATESQATLRPESQQQEDKVKYQEDSDGDVTPYRTSTSATTTSDMSVTSADTIQTAPLKVKPWYKRLNPLKRSTKPPFAKERATSREYQAGFFSLLTFQWMAPLMSLGYQRTLEINDIPLVNPGRQVEILSQRLQASFAKRAARGDRYPLLFALHEALKFELWFGGVCSLVASILQVLTPFTLRYLIAFAGKAYLAQSTGRPAPNIGHGIGLVVGISIMQLVQSMCVNHYIYRGQMVGSQARAVLIDAIFEKAMTISGRAKAGGKARDDISKQEDRSERPEDLREKKKSFLSLVLKKNQKQSKGPKQTTEQSQNQTVSGDGLGWSNGRIVNLMSTDTQRIDLACGMMHQLWTSPIAIVITLIVLLVNLSYSALAGFGLLVLGTPLVTRVVKSLLTRRRAINKITDQRVTLTQEILHAVKFVKFFGWESSFLQRLYDLRRREIRAIQLLLAVRNAINAVSMSLPTFASMLSFITYDLSKHPLDPAPVFSSLALFNSLRLPLNLLPLIISQVTDAWTSIIRVQDFMMAENQDEDIIWNMEAESAVTLKQADFTWERTVTREEPELSKKEKKEANLLKVRQHDKQSESTFKTDIEASEKTAIVEMSKSEQKRADPSQIRQHEKASETTIDTDSEASENTAVDPPQPFNLQKMNFSVGRNELIAVIGGVGSGKSSLLAALAGDMRRTAGEVTIGASRAFCPQYSWIQNATVKDNILFGKEYDPIWYNQVIDACALRQDLEMLPHDDLTEIGERGITISGGQKQRLNVARAIYFRSDLVLFDDPLSAVDSHVGRHIFDHAICGLLKDKCRILATHQLHVLSRCDRIIWMQEGRIETIDSFPNLMENNEAFRKLMAATAQEEQVEDKKHPGANDKKAAKKRKAKQSAALMQQEERAIKAVPWSVYNAYVSASGSIFYGPLLVLALVISQGASILLNLWLSWWTSDHFKMSRGAYIGVYSGLGVLSALLMFGYSVALSVVGTRSSRVLLQQAMYRVLRAPMHFFDTTPLGRITNRFSKDVDVMDNNLTDAFRMYSFTLAMIISVFILIIAYFPYFAIALAPLFIMFLFSASYYRASAREVKRIESILRSGVYARFGEAVAGTSSIRAYRVQDKFISAVRSAIDNQDSAYFLTFANQRWLAVRLDAIGNILVFVTGILVITSRFDVNPSIAGLVLSYILTIVQMIQFTVRQLAEVENGMTSVERLHYYGNKLDEEAPLKLKNVPESWPPSGEIVFNEVQMRYRAELPLVLQGLNLRVTGGERIGIVGRTGAGKSSIMSALFRLVELSGGSISIDGINIASIGLKDLRTRLAIIPQDPTLFKGTIRSNLDPFDEHTDLELWSALRQADLVDANAKFGDKSTGRIQLDGIVEDEGLNYSLGQRQLLALSRALVRGSQIIVCDEATSSVDLETDQKIQETMASAFKGKTMLCIAHRLRTIIGYDRICVIDQGAIAELDTPLRLYDEGGIFRGMCESSGIRREDFGAEKQ